jgi:hypothetical protein
MVRTRHNDFSGHYCADPAGDQHPAEEHPETMTWLAIRAMLGT